AALGNPAKERHLAAFEQPATHLSASAGPLAFAAARGRLTVTAARTAADALLTLVLVNALMHGGQVHYSGTPLRRATSSGVRRRKSTRRVVCNRLIGWGPPPALAKIWRAPRASRPPRPPGPVLTRFPGPAGTRTTLLLPYLPMTRWGIVASRIWIFFCRRM